MGPRASLIDHLRTRQPATWSLLKLAASQGLASVDASAGRLQLDSDLRQRHQRLHFVLDRLMREWQPDEPIRAPVARPAAALRPATSKLSKPPKTKSSRRSGP